MKTATQFQYALRMGAILGLLSVILSVLFWMMGLHTESWVQWISWILSFGWIVYSIKTYRDEQLGGYISFGKAVGTGVLVNVIGTLIAMVYFIVFIQYIEPGFIEQLMEKAEQQMIERGMSDEQVEQAIAMQAKFMTPVGMFIWGMVGSTFGGTIFSLIAAAFLRKYNDSFESFTSDSNSAPNS